MLTICSCFDFILLLPIFGVASEIMISFPNSTLPPSFVVTKRDYIDFDWPCTDSCRSHGFVMRVSRQSRLVTGSSATRNYKHSSLVRPASFAWGEKGVWPTSIEALMTAEYGSNFTSRKIRNFHLTIHNISCFDSSSLVTATVCIPRLLHIST